MTRHLGIDARSTALLPEPALDALLPDAGRERLAVLARRWRPARQAFEQAMKAYRRAEVGRDDILDAMVLAVTASLPAGRRTTLPASPRRDEKGLRMEMVRATLPMDRRIRKPIEIGL